MLNELDGILGNICVISVLGMIEWALAVIYKFSGGEKEEGRLLNADIKLAIALLANEIFRGESY